MLGYWAAFRFTRSAKYWSPLSPLLIKVHSAKAGILAKHSTNDSPEIANLIFVCPFPLALFQLDHVDLYGHFLSDGWRKSVPRWATPARTTYRPPDIRFIQPSTWINLAMPAATNTNGDQSRAASVILHQRKTTSVTQIFFRSGYFLVKYFIALSFVVPGIDAVTRPLDFWSNFALSV